GQSALGNQIAQAGNAADKADRQIDSKPRAARRTRRAGNSRAPPPAKSRRTRANVQSMATTGSARALRESPVPCLLVEIAAAVLVSFVPAEARLFAAAAFRAPEPLSPRGAVAPFRTGVGGVRGVAAAPDECRPS